MSSRVVDDLASPWQTDPSGLWAVTVAVGAGRIDAGPGMTISARAGQPGGPSPFARRSFSPALDLGPYDELRFWIRSTRPAGGSPASPFYLALEIAGGPALPRPWLRLLGLRGGGAWELQALWLGDLPAANRQAIASLTLRSLDPSVQFEAVVSDVIAARPEPVQDVDAAFFARLNNRYRVLSGNRTVEVPAILDLPESPGGRTPPYLLITPWAVRQLQDRGGAGELVDNFTGDGSFVRPARRLLELDYGIDVFGETRAQKALLLDSILADFDGKRPLVVSDELVRWVPFTPSADELAASVRPGRTPLFYRLGIEMETGPRRFHAQARPQLAVAHVGDSSREAVVVPQ